MANGNANPDINDIPDSSGGKPIGVFGTSLLSAYLLFIGFLVLYGLIVFWPTPIGKTPASNLESTTTTPPPAPPATNTTPPPAGTPAPGAAGSSAQVNPPKGSQGTSKNQSAPKEICQDVKYFRWKGCIPKERILLLIVLLAGALGGLVHALRSLYWYVGNRRLVLSWSLMYVLLPFLGATMGLVFYLVIRGGFFPTANVDDTNPLGFAALAVLAGMFSREAAEKLKQIFETILTRAEKGKDHVAAAPVISKIDPPTGSVNGGYPVTITGSGFVPESVVSFGSQLAQKPQVSNGGTTLTVVAPKASAPGQVTVEIVNPGDQKATGTFTYTEDHVATAPVISKIDPPTGSVNGGYPVTITGSGFVPESIVSFGGQPTQKPQASNGGTTLTVVAPKASAPGQVTVEIVNPGDHQKATGSFTYTP